MTTPGSGSYISCNFQIVMPGNDTVMWYENSWFLIMSLPGEDLVPLLIIEGNAKFQPTVEIFSPPKTSVLAESVKSIGHCPLITFITDDKYWAWLRQRDPASASCSPLEQVRGTVRLSGSRAWLAFSVFWCHQFEMLRPGCLTGKVPGQRSVNCSRTPSFSPQMSPAPR